MDLTPILQGLPAFSSLEDVVSRLQPHSRVLLSVVEGKFLTTFSSPAALPPLEPAGPPGERSYFRHKSSGQLYCFFGKEAGEYLLRKRATPDSPLAAPRCSSEPNYSPRISQGWKAGGVSIPFWPGAQKARDSGPKKSEKETAKNRDYEPGEIAQTAENRDYDEPGEIAQTTENRHPREEKKKYVWEIKEI